ncbi:MAG: MBL fold metallo-hydrolase [Rhodospirillaceae bacterium]|nr:MBL fold metallo-hydrolase [Rhodospirillaceae bacterium]
MSFLQALDFPIPVLRTGEVREVAPGVHWLRMRLPYRLNHVNLWILEDGEGLTVVDTGMNMPETRETWEAVLTSTFSFRRVHRVIGTHYHSDHIGLAAWLCETYGAPLFMSLVEWATARTLAIDQTQAFFDVQMAFYHRLGYSPELLARLQAVGNAYASKVLPVPPQMHRLRDGESLSIGGRMWRLIAAPGHAPEMMCLYQPDLGVLIAGDHILPTITPNVSIYPAEPEGDPLGDYLGSFGPFLDLPEETLVLPSHGRPFYGLWRRIRQIEAHHAERLQRVVSACASPRCIIDMLGVLFEDGLSDHERVIASGEALAHVRYLHYRGHLAEITGADGVMRFVAV